VITEAAEQSELAAAARVIGLPAAISLRAFHDRLDTIGMTLATALTGYVALIAEAKHREAIEPETLDVVRADARDASVALACLSLEFAAVVRNLDKVVVVATSAGY
jgi:hypothetical protein